MNLILVALLVTNLIVFGSSQTTTKVTNLEALEGFEPASRKKSLKYQPSCSATPKCKALGLTGDCCPTTEGKYLACCPSRRCKKYPACAGLQKHCCPDDSGKFLDCCSVMCGKKGDKCNTDSDCCPRLFCQMKQVIQQTSTFVLRPRDWKQQIRQHSGRERRSPSLGWDGTSPPSLDAAVAALRIPCYVH